MKCGGSGSPVIDFAVAFFSFLGDPIGTILNGIADAVLAAAIMVFGSLVTDLPTLPSADTSKEINAETQWLVVYLAVGSLLFAAARMAIERRSDAGQTALKGILRVVLVSGAGSSVVMAAAALSDNYSNYLFKGAAQETLRNVGGCSDGGSLEGFLLLILAFLLLISGIIHTILLYVRLGVMILLLGTLPLAAAASMTDWGGGWWRKHIGWMIAWLLYKPAAGLVMYAGAVMMSSGNGDFAEGTGSGDLSANERIAGIAVMLLSAVALPALLKLVVPATAALGGASAASGAMSAAGGAVASGARSLGSRALGGGSGGAAGQSGPRGASGTSGASGGGGSPGSGGKAGPTGASRPGTSTPGSSSPGAGGSGAAAGAGRAAAAAGGPAGAAVGAAVTAAQVAGRTVAHSLDGADGDRGHNR
ncbi:hypothetical protein [Streptomyces mayonensis]|uniref:hypothetical protein n=1 Tax=Streptomyces mayonensis TaxID=2750816 RepID=UPI001C1DD35E|nr:hypothetical protein [Streptomyces sp. A108]MBU6535509.1 hypothetical protein [Streptomyces sp. A108]